MKINDHELVMPLAPQSTRQLTIADAIAYTRVAALPKRQRERRISYLKGAAEICGRDPSAVPLSIPWLQQHFYSAAPAVHGLSRRHHGNIANSLRWVLREFGLHAEHGNKGRKPVSPAWMKLVDLAPDKPRQSCVRRFGTWSTERHLEPLAVTDQALREYQSEVANTKLAAGTAKLASIIARTWNGLLQAYKEATGIALQPLSAPARRQTYTLPLTAYPASFQQEVRDFAETLSGATGRVLFLPKRGQEPGSRLRQKRRRPATVKARLFAVQQAAGILVQKGVPVAEIDSLRALVEPIERVEDVLEFLAERQRDSHQELNEVKGGQVAQVAITLAQVAEFIASPNKQEIDGFVQHLGTNRTGFSKKVRDRLRQLIQPRSRMLLLHLPQELMRQAALPGVKPREAARLALLAVALEILLICPLRLGSLLCLRLDKHVQRLGTRRNRVTHLVLREQDTKNSEPLEWPVPKDSADMIEKYLRLYRPTIAKPDNPFLFPSDSGVGARSPGGLSTALVGRIETLVGVACHLHLLRHFAAWMHLKAYPGAYEEVRRVLGHRDIKTTVSYYTVFDQAVAAERFDSNILRERKATKGAAQLHWRKRAGKKGRSS